MEITSPNKYTKKYIYVWNSLKMNWKLARLQYNQVYKEDADAVG